MKSKNKIFYIIMLATLVSSVTGIIIAASIMSPFEVVPIFGLPNFLNMILFMAIWPILGSILLVIICPKIFSRLYLKVKGIMLHDYKNGYIEMQKPEFSIKEFITRAFYCFLLSIGLFIILENSGILDFNLLLPKSALETAKQQNIPLRYNISVFIYLVLAFLPFSIAIFSIGWAIEDVGLIHYNLPGEESNKLFEIEPVHVRYNSYIKGYAGISSIFYYFSVIYYMSTNLDLSMGALGILTLWGYISLFLMVLVWSFPSYLIYLKINKKYLRKNIPQRRRITDKEYES